MLDPYKSSQIQTNNFSSPPPNTLRAFTCKTGPSRDLRSPKSKRLKPRALSLKEWDIIHFWPFEDLRLTQIRQNFYKFPFGLSSSERLRGFQNVKSYLFCEQTELFSHLIFPGSISEWIPCIVTTSHSLKTLSRQRPPRSPQQQVIVLCYKTECWHQWKHNEKEMLL